MLNFFGDTLNSFSSNIDDEFRNKINSEQLTTPLKNKKNKLRKLLIFKKPHILNK
jgi:hypothetical protein